LKQAQPQLCYSCHDGTGAATNVIDGTSGTKALRGGGFNNAQIGSGLATKDVGTVDTGHGYPSINQTIPALTTFVKGGAGTTTSKHQIDGNTAGVAWGNYTDVAVAATATIAGNNGGLGKSITLECGSCHDPHGNGNYRVLRPIPNDANNVVTPAVKEVKDASGVVTTVGVPAVMSITTGVNIPDAASNVYTTTNYWLSGDSTVPAGGTTLTGTAKTGDPAGDGYVQNVAAWCTTCHTRYMAGSGSYGKPLAGTGTLVRAGQTDLVGVDVNYTYRHRSDANYKGGAANCITCHVSHGSNASVTSTAVAGGLNPGDSPAAAGDSRLLRVDNRGTCSMCHNV